MNKVLAQVARFFIFLISLMPLSFARGIGILLGSLSWWFKDRGAKVTLDNLLFCFPEIGKVERARIAKESLCETYKIAGETFLVWHRNKAWAKARILAVHGEALLRDSVAEGRGVILVVPHLGNWEFLGSQLHVYAEVTSMYQPPKKPWLEDLVREKRGGLGMKLAPTSSKGVAIQLRALKAGEMIVTLPDQVPADGGGIFSSFYGMPAYSMTLIHGYIQRTQCKVVMGVAKRVESGFELHFLAPDEGIYSEDQKQSVDALNRSVEKCVSLCMTQYQWEYKRFKRQPNGKNPYSA